MMPERALFVGVIFGIMAILLLLYVETGPCRQLNGPECGDEHRDLVLTVMILAFLSAVFVTLSSVRLYRQLVNDDAEYTAETAAVP